MKEIIINLLFVILFYSIYKIYIEIINIKENFKGVSRLDPKAPVRNRLSTSSTNRQDSKKKDEIKKLQEAILKRLSTSSTNRQEDIVKSYILDEYPDKKLRDTLMKYISETLVRYSKAKEINNILDAFDKSMDKKEFMNQLTKLKLNNDDIEELKNKLTNDANFFLYETTARKLTVASYIIQSEMKNNYKNKKESPISAAVILRVNDSNINWILSLVRDESDRLIKQSLSVFPSEDQTKEIEQFVRKYIKDNLVRYTNYRDLDDLVNAFNSSKEDFIKELRKQKFLIETSDRATLIDELTNLPRKMVLNPNYIDEARKMKIASYKIFSEFIGIQELQITSKIKLKLVDKNKKAIVKNQQLLLKFIDIETFNIIKTRYGQKNATVQAIEETSSITDKPNDEQKDQLTKYLETSLIGNSKSEEINQLLKSFRNSAEDDTKGFEYFYTEVRDKNLNVSIDDAKKLYAKLLTVPDNADAETNAKFKLAGFKILSDFNDAYFNTAQISIAPKFILKLTDENMQFIKDFADR